MQESTRQKKFARVILKELSQIIRQKVEPELGCMITVSFVRVTADLQIARVYITCLPEEKLPMVLKILNAETLKIRHLLAKEIRHLTKVMPSLTFYEDDTLKYANRIDELLAQIKNQNNSNPSPE
ncbi:MAG: 30S ribosome-binding factor RbfA [Bacteroidia bacterium]|nr:30S ribosome-binding factor RbfA [Bacteroidia bacterium]MDW8158489.1 30S ribosome-binding factor RbfA [Bacteroidia bacterium]